MDAKLLRNIFHLKMSEYMLFSGETEEQKKRREK